MFFIPPNVPRIGSLAVVFALLVACGGDNTESSVQAPGTSKTATTRALGAGAALLQDKPPIEALNEYLNGFHFYSGRLDVQMEAHHYCNHVNEEVTQCVLYDGNGRTAKLVGIEYVLSERLFASLPETEKSLWHSHAYEVRSGQLIAPGIPQVVEHALMQKLATTYGKTWHTWHTASDSSLPTGIPQLMMGFTADGQVDPVLLAKRDKRFGVRTSDKRKAREDLPVPAIDPGADAWQKGEVLQLEEPIRTGHLHGGTEPLRPPQSVPPAQPTATPPHGQGGAVR